MHHGHTHNATLGSHLRLTDPGRFSDDDPHTQTCTDLLSRSLQDLSELTATIAATCSAEETSAAAGRVLAQKTALLHRRLTRLSTVVKDVEYFAYHDPLTGLPNRALLLDRMEQSIASARRTDRQLALMIIDLDKFKPLNDRHGHPVGDRILQHVAAMLRTGLRSSDTPCRLGGDEFALMLPEISSADSARTIAKKVRARIATPLRWRGHQLRVTASVGIAVYPEDGNSASDLFEKADASMYAAKSSAERRAITTG
ncbi:MAG: GGDEF domain-containing protein [Gammaproteobacteria bacterium]